MAVAMEIWKIGSDMAIIHQNSYNSPDITSDRRSFLSQSKFTCLSMGIHSVYVQLPL